MGRLERLEVALVPSEAVPSRRMSAEELQRLRELKARLGFGARRASEDVSQRRPRVVGDRDGQHG